MKRTIGMVLVCVLAPTVAVAQPKQEPKTAEGWYNEGTDQYDHGAFEAAIEAFKKGMDLEKVETNKAAYLYNIGQAYRQLGKCREARFFFGRYLDYKDTDTKKPLKPDERKEVEDLIKAQDECIKQLKPDKPNPDKPDPTKPNPDKPNPDKPNPDKRVGDIKQPPDGDPGIDKQLEPTKPRLVSLRLIAGGAKIGVGKLRVPLQATGALLAGYPLAIGSSLTVDLGAGFGFTPVPYDAMNNESRSAQLIAAFANAGATYAASSKIGLRADLGVGALVFSGVSKSPFTDFAATTGGLTMAHVRVGVSADYAFTPNWIATLAPIAFSYSPAKAGLVNQGQRITAITAIDFMIGLGYRM